jgi:hypothetical protein
MQSKGMTIASNAVLFRALIDTMYSDKIGSIMRELWTNAWDSHVEAGKADIPFKVSLPTILTPELTIRDFGVSMTEQVIDEIFGTIGSSTKRESNDVAGKFGVGSKSPYSYTDAYTVTCYLDGEVRVYAIFINEADEPDYALMARGPTDEPDGVAVSFAVHEKDFRDFRRAAARTAIPFDVPPIINLDDESFDEIPAVLREGKGWKLYEKTNFKIGVRIKMGCVTYPVDLEFLDEDVKNRVKNANLIVEVPIGDCDIILSREGLSYDEDTVFNVRRAINEALEDMARVVQAELSSATSYRDACQKLYEVQRTYKQFGIEFDGTSATYDGVPAATKNWLPAYMLNNGCVMYRSQFEGPRPAVIMDTKDGWRHFSPSEGIKDVDTTLLLVTCQGDSSPFLGNRVKQLFEDNKERFKGIRHVTRLDFRHGIKPDKKTLSYMFCGLPEDQIVFGAKLPLDRTRIGEVDRDDRGPFHMTRGTLGYVCLDKMPEDVDCCILTSGAHHPDPDLYPKSLVDDFSKVVRGFAAMGWYASVLHLPKKQRDLKDEIDLPDFFDIAKRKLKNFGSQKDIVHAIAFHEWASRYHYRYSDTKDFTRFVSVIVKIEEEFQASELIDPDSAAKPLLDQVRKALDFRGGKMDRSKLDALTDIYDGLGRKSAAPQKLAAQINLFDAMTEVFAQNFPMTALIATYRMKDQSEWGIADFLDYLNRVKAPEA